MSLEAGKRAGSVPPDTAEKPLLVWDKGFLQEDAYTGDEVEIETLIGRRFRGRLCNRPVHYQHDFGEMQPELIRIHQQVTKIAFGEAEA
ncbi:MAG: 2-amino-4-oxopentanoate thiolase subunit OrtA [Clostridiales bacterium]|nr:2-amino-4-oxopentanoate thiolase subunit OrtA [Clostridiales bacterium]